EAATDTGVIQRPPSLDYSTRYVAFADAAGGARAGGDSFALAICRGDQNGVVYLDRLLEREPPFHPATTVAEFVEMLGRIESHTSPVTISAAVGQPVSFCVTTLNIGQVRGIRASFI